MRIICISLLLLSSALALAQSGIPHLPSSDISISAFIPDRWVALDTAIGDLNNDRRDDVVLVLQCRDTLMGDTIGMAVTDHLAPPRTLVVLFGTVDGYKVSFQNDRFILRANEGGWFDPYEGVEVQDGKLLIHFYGGSGWRFSNSYTFRYGDHGFELIRAEALNYSAADGAGTSRSIDFLAHRMTVTTGNMTEEEESNNARQQDIPAWPLRTFDTFVRPFTWRIDADLKL